MEYKEKSNATSTLNYHAITNINYSSISNPILSCAVKLQFDLTFYHEKKKRKKKKKEKKETQH